MPIQHSVSQQLYKERQQKLIQEVQQTYKDADNGVIVLFAGFESDHVPFMQERSFYYLTGITEPASAFMIDVATGKSTLFVPNFGAERQKWVAGALTLDDAQKIGVDQISYLGNPCHGYQCHPFFTQDEYSDLLKTLELVLKKNRTIFTLFPQGRSGYIEQRFVVQRIGALLPNFLPSVKDISPIVAHMRRIKGNEEIEMLFKAIEITTIAHDMAAQAIKPGALEYEVQAALEYSFCSEGGALGFPSIVASGKNSTILHYNENNKTIDKGDLVVVDIGAQYGYYCADLTRTYPAAGAFSKRQKEIYNLVLDTQEYIASLAKPGMFLSNADEPDNSLNHLAKKFLDEKGYGNYFPHGIGHYLGMDVHDVGDYNKPLEAGDVITIEPGIYIPQENLGVRIEDDYWIVPNGNICLSENLERHPDEIEQMMQEETEED